MEPQNNNTSSPPPSAEAVEAESQVAPKDLTPKPTPQPKPLTTKKTGNSTNKKAHAPATNLQHASFNRYSHAPVAANDKHKVSLVIQSNADTVARVPVIAFVGLLNTPRGGYTSGGDFTAAQILQLSDSTVSNYSDPTGNYFRILHGRTFEFPDGTYEFHVSALEGDNEWDHLKFTADVEDKKLKLVKYTPTMLSLDDRTAGETVNISFSPDNTGDNVNPVPIGSVFGVRKFLARMPANQMERHEAYRVNSLSLALHDVSNFLKTDVPIMIYYCTDPARSAPYSANASLTNGYYDTHFAFKTVFRSGFSQVINLPVRTDIFQTLLDEGNSRASSPGFFGVVPMVGASGNTPNFQYAVTVTADIDYFVPTYSVPPPVSQGVVSLPFVNRTACETYIDTNTGELYGKFPYNNIPGTSSASLFPLDPTSIRLSFTDDSVPTAPVAYTVNLPLSKLSYIYLSSGSSMYFSLYNIFNYNLPSSLLQDSMPFWLEEVSQASPLYVLYTTPTV